MVLQRKQARRGVVVAGLLALGALGAEAGGWAAAEGPSTPAVVVPLEPARILDTRFGTGAPAGKVTADQTISLQVTGVGGVPVGASAVVVNLTVTEADGAGYVSAYPGGDSRPNASVLNYTSGEDIANMVTATLSPSGTLDIYNAQSSVHLVADVAGYLIPDGGVGMQGPQGPQGIAGPAGPPGPEGPAGPGASVFVNVPVPNQMAPTVIGAQAGFQLSAGCGVGGMGLTINATAAGLLRITGVRHNQDGTMSDMFIGSGPGDWTEPANGATSFSFTGVVDAAGTTSWVNLGIRTGSPCFVWGTIIPDA